MWASVSEREGCGRPAVGHGRGAHHPRLLASRHRRRVSSAGRPLVESPIRPTAYAPPRAAAAPDPDRAPLLKPPAPTAARDAPRSGPRHAASVTGDSDEDACPTCLEPFTADHPPSTLDCGHAFHLACHLAWEERCGSVGRGLECPLCAAPQRESAG
jgi:hypothetical protein